MSIQSVIDRAVNQATTAALAGMPVRRIIWIPPQTPSQHEDGAFAVEYLGPTTPATTTPWSLT